MARVDMLANEVCDRPKLSHQVPVNEVLAAFDDSIAYLHFLLGGWGGPSHQVEWGSNLIRGLLMRFATDHKLSHQVPVNEVLAVFDDSIAYLHFLLGGWGGAQPPSRMGVKPH